MRRSVAVLWLLLLVVPASSCTLPTVWNDLREESPQFDLGRPPWVRYSARAGAVVGGVVGAVASVVLLPVTWPISLIADEPLGYANDEFVFLPVSVGASTGHFLLGAPTDTVDYLFHRAWVDDHRASDYDYVPAAPPAAIHAEHEDQNL